MPVLCQPIDRYVEAAVDWHPGLRRRNYECQTNQILSG